MKPIHKHLSEVSESKIASKNGGNLNETESKDFTNRQKAEEIYRFRKALRESVERAKERDRKKE